MSPILNAASAQGRGGGRRELELGPADIEQAARDLLAYLSPTPLQYSRAFTDKARCHVHLKIESIQPIRAFKVRGALNKLIRMTAAERAAGVMTASAGNHGLGVAYAAAAFQAPATVYVPETANTFKVEAIRRLGAKVVAAGRNYNGAYLEALAAQKESGATFVHAYNDPDVVAGQGTIATELLSQLEDAGRAQGALPFDTVLVPIGGGGLIGGIALYLKSKKPGVKVCRVEPSGQGAVDRRLQVGSDARL